MERKLGKVLAISALTALAAIFVACGSGGGASQDASQSGHGGTGSPPGGAAQSSVPVKADDAAVSYVGKFSVSPERGTIGSPVTASGSGFAPNTSLAVVWQAFDGSWVTQNESYLGRTFKEVIQPLTTVQTDASGSFQTQFNVPDGFGFYHDVRVMQDNTIRNKSAFYVQMELSITPTSGPPGTPITIEAKGVGWQSLENSWGVLYDNKYTGFLSAVTTNGHATAVIPATGSPGKHVLNVLHASLTVPYMNMQQSPEPDRPTWSLPFTVTKGQAVLPAPAATQGLARDTAVLGVANTTGPSVATDFQNGPVGSPLTLTGKGFSPDASVELLWFREVGSRVSGQSYTEASVPLATVTVGSDGKFSYPLQTPDDLGGDHRIEARVNGQKVAQANYVITPSAFPLSAGSGPAGTTVTLHLKGGGWTETANIYTVVYDNGYVGYACAFNSQGDITVYLSMTGDPGWHYIDLYPAIYKGKEVAGVDNFRIPQLTFALDHPHEKLPAFHFAFQVTD